MMGFYKLNSNPFLHNFRIPCTKNSKDSIRLTFFLHGKVKEDKRK